MPPSAPRSDPSAVSASVDVILPCLNEALALPWVLGRFAAPFRPLLADNRSTDGSVDIAREWGCRVVDVPQRGYGAAVHAGLMAAQTELVAVMDADASLDPTELPRVSAPVLEGRSQLSVGRRRPHTRSAWPPHARLGNAVVSRRLRQRTGYTVHDIGPMRVARRSEWIDLGVTDRRFGYPLQMLVLAAEAGWSLSEVDVPYLDRAAGSKSKVTGTVRGTLHAVRDMSRVLAR